MSPQLETISTLPLRLDLPDALELIWVSGNQSTLLDLTFRDSSGKVVHSDSLTFGSESQVFLSVQETWPQLRGLRGTLEWKVPFPGADIYESVFLGGVALSVAADGSVSVVHGMTLPANQAKSSPH